ncbi:MAG TPA: hypothetical protein VKU60_12550 [Chloroflexota bacterium]|nr:hypothetical protein [Chloroflexota bacterium]
MTVSRVRMLILLVCCCLVAASGFALPRPATTVGTQLLMAECSAQVPSVVSPFSKDAPVLLATSSAGEVSVYRSADGRLQIAIGDRILLNGCTQGSSSSTCCANTGGAQGCVCWTCTNSGCSPADPGGNGSLCTNTD